MKVEITYENLLIVPETDFEAAYLERYRNREMEGFLEYRNIPAAVVGLTIQPGKIADKVQPEDLADKNKEYWRKNGISDTSINPVTGNLRL